MKTIFIVGSHRENSQSLKVAKWLAHETQQKGDSYETDIIDLAAENLPMWDQAAWNKDSDLTKLIKPFQDRVAAADAIVLLAPEWGGMVPAALKNFLLYISAAHAAHKPTLIVGISSGRGGTYPISELRMSGYKNNYMTYIPEHLIVQHVEDVMNQPELESGEQADQYIKERASYTLGVLMSYAVALKTMRDNPVHPVQHKSYPFGM
jgi:NAD(P)H-dependent FMN reductase